MCHRGEWISPKSVRKCRPHPCPDDQARVGAFVFGVRLKCSRRPNNVFKIDGAFDTLTKIIKGGREASVFRY